MLELAPEQTVGTQFVGALFFGLYLSTLFHTIRWLVFADEGWKVRKKISWTMLTITIVIFILSTVYQVLDLKSSMSIVFKASKPKPPPPSGSVLSATALPWVAVVGCTNAKLSTLLADAVLIYRCWIIYGKSRWVIVFPIFVWMGGLVLTILQAYWQIVQKASILLAWGPVNMVVGPGTILMPFWASTIILNGYATFMIVRRIYKMAKESEGCTSIHQLRFVRQILIESGFLYLAVAIAHFISWWTPNSYAIEVISAINASMTGIAFNLVLIRIARSRVEEATKAANLELISGIRFRMNEIKTPAGQFGIDTTGPSAFCCHEDSTSLNQPSVRSIV